MSVALSYNLGAIPRLQNRIALLGKVDRRGLLDLVGAEVESQTKRRIETEKSGPDGIPWDSWSPGYAETRHGGHSLLEADGHLLGSIDHQVAGDDSVEIGSNLVYARIQQEGSGSEPVTVPAHKRLITKVFGRELSFGVWASVDTYRFVQNIPARPYLGLSGENEHDIEAIVDSFIDGVLGL